MRDRTDEALMKAYAEGNVEAFELLYDRHRVPLYRYVLRHVGDAATANDLYQGSWEKIIKARKSYNTAAPFQAWMFRIAHNHVMDFFRRSKPVSDLPAEDMAATTPGPGEEFLAGNREEKLHEALIRLPPEQKEVFLLKLESGLDLQAIAEITGVNRETVKSRLRYAVAKLKKILRE